MDPTRSRARRCSSRSAVCSARVGTSSARATSAGTGRGIRTARRRAHPSHRPDRVPCDAFSAMTTTARTAAAARTEEAALAELRANAGTQFDPDVERSRPSSAAPLRSLAGRIEAVSLRRWSQPWRHSPGRRLRWTGSRRWRASRSKAGSRSTTATAASSSSANTESGRLRGDHAMGDARGRAAGTACRAGRDARPAAATIGVTVESFEVYDVPVFEVVDGADGCRPRHDGRRELPAARLADRPGAARRPAPAARSGTELWRVPEPYLEEAQDDATRLAVQDMERAGVDIVTDGEMRRESYSNRFATALEGVDLDNPGVALDRTGTRTRCRASSARSAARARWRFATSSSCAR